VQQVVEGTAESNRAAASNVPSPNGQSTTDTEAALAEVLTDLLTVDGLSVESNFFEDLGADSLKMAHFCVRVRKRDDLPSISIRDVYENPTIKRLAAAVEHGAPSNVEPSVPAPAPAPSSARTSQYVLCGTLQLLAFVAYCYLAALVGANLYDWIAAGSGLVDMYLRAVIFSGGVFFAVCTLPIVAKWLLIGRWKPQPVQIWSLAYFRFWLVKVLVRSNPGAHLFVGSPLYNLYLRALGAKIGPGVAIFSRHLPVCTDLLTIGANTVVRRDSLFPGYRAYAGRIETGRITIGRDALVGEKAVLDIDTSVGDGAQLGHASVLHPGRVIPAGERWHGSPAEPTDVDYLRVPQGRRSRLRQIGFSVNSVLAILFLALPLLEGGVDLLLTATPSLGRVLDPSGSASGGFTLTGLAIEALVVSLVLFLGLALIGLLFAGVVTRGLSLFLKPDRVYPLYGFHDRIHRVIARTTRIKFFTYLFGDSSFIVHYLRYLGVDLSRVEQTGSNFGIEVTAANPRLSFVGTGTMVADGLAIINDEVSSTSFSVTRAEVGPRNFLGNDVAYPAGGKTGDNCLIGTKAMVPLHGEVREDAGLLGSPAFPIPRSVERDSRFDHLRSGQNLKRGLAAKTRYNVRTIGIFLFARWVGVFLVVLLQLAALELHGELANVPMAVLFGLSLVVSIFYFALAERAVALFRPLKPTYCSIYHPDFWRHERLWKIPAMEHFHAFDGTPFKNIVWRVMGVKVGRRVFDDGVHISERTLTSLGDDCVLNFRSKIQCHSQEDGTFKTDRSSIGAGCTVGGGSFVNYGVTMGYGSTLAADSFLMKGEEVPARTRWGGNPAQGDVS